MSNISYDRNKIEDFKKAFEEYSTAKVIYRNQLEKFEKNIEFMKNNYNDTNDSYLDSGGSFVINRNGVMMRTSTASSGYDTSINHVIRENGGSVFLTDLKFQADTSIIDNTNKMYQVGLDDLKYDNDIENSISNPFVSVSQDPDVSNSSSCDMNHLYQCSAKAKMENKPYYGIEGKVGEVCNCYIFDELPTNTVSERLQTVTLDSSGSYLAILMDGNLYRVSKTNYSENYDNFFEYDTENNTNLSLMMNGNLNDSGDLNPFTGNGINTIDITGIAENCVEK